MAKCDQMKIVGIKQVASKKSGRLYTTYYCQHGFSDYELDNSVFAVGIAVEEVTTTEAFDLHLGDVVEFNYGKALGDYQPVKSYTMVVLAKAQDVAAVKESANNLETEPKPDKGKKTF